MAADGEAGREALIGASRLEGVALVHQKLLPLGREVHLRGVGADQRVEEGVVLVRGRGTGEGPAWARFGPQDAPEALRLLPGRGRNTRRRQMDCGARLKW